MRPQPASWTSLSPAILLVTAACSGGLDGGPDGPSFTVRDSAGVEIIENLRTAWDEASAWTVGDSAFVTIGVQQGPEEYQLFRVTGAVRLPDGGVAIANSGTGQVRFYDAAGVHIRSVGRQGEGPGEFQRINALAWFNPDSLAVWDGGLRRVTVFGVDGGLGRMPANFFEDFTFVYFTGFTGASALVARRGSGFQPDTIRAGFLDMYSEHLHVVPGGATIDLGRSFSNTNYITPDGGVALMPFSRNAEEAVAPGFLVLAANDSYDLLVVPFGDAPRRSIRASRPPIAVTDELIERWIEASTASIDEPNARATRAASLEALTYPDVVPAYAQVMVDRSRFIWALDYALPWDEHSTWTVFSPEGVELGRVTMPLGLTVYEIGPDYVLARERDELGVEMVVAYPLIKPE